jgi:ubiquinone/menaquinone biosynthesis C-methylase UbiE
MNFDASYTLRWERLPLIGKLYTKNGRRFPARVRYGDIVSGLPLPARSCEGVYASHVLEHLALQDLHTALENTRRILKTGGIFRLVVPDLQSCADQYLRKLTAGDAQANEFFLTAVNLGCRARARGIRAMIYNALNTSQHLWMWDDLSMQSVLREHGFKTIRRCCFGDCEDPMFALVEDKSRFADAIALEARI